MKLMMFKLVVILTVFRTGIACAYFRGTNNTKESHTTRGLARKGRVLESLESADPNVHNQQTQSPSKCTTSPSVSPLTSVSVTDIPTEDNTGRLGFCRKRALPVTRENICRAYHSVREDFEAVTADQANVSSIYGISVRLAFHDAADLDVSASDSLGSDGCLSDDSGNNGLTETDSLVNTLLEPIWQRTCDLISRGDFWVLFAKLVLEKADPTQSMHVPYHFGRRDVTSCNAAIGRLPEADFGLPELERVFVNQMGLTLSEGVTLLGAHTLGHTHIPNAGYGQLLSAFPASVSEDLINAWDDSPSQFDNHYHQNLAGGATWTHFPSTSSTETEWHVAHGQPAIMLNVDMGLAFDPILADEPPLGLGQSCGIASGVYREAGCVLPSAGLSPTAAQIQAYVYSNALFLSDFSAAFTKMVTGGYAIEGVATPPGKSTKIGTLIPIDLHTCEGGGW